MGTVNNWWSGMSRGDLETIYGRTTDRQTQREIMAVLDGLDGDVKPSAIRAVNPKYPTFPHATCPTCSRVIQIRADGQSLFTHNRAKGVQCPISRVPITITEA